MSSCCVFPPSVPTASLSAHHRPTGWRAGSCNRCRQCCRRSSLRDEQQQQQQQHQVTETTAHRHLKHKDEGQGQHRRALLLAGLTATAAVSRCAAAHAGMTRHQQQQQHQWWTPHATPPLASIQADYDRYAASYDQLDGGAASQALGLPELRGALLQQAHGDVLEVGVGTGLNLPLYTWSGLRSLTGADLSAGMLAQAADRVAAGSVPGTRLVAGDGSSSSSSSSDGVPVQLVQADVTALPFPEASFDCVVDTFSLCVFADPAAALAQLARVLRPGGALLLLEHTRSDNPLLGAYMDATRGVVAPLSKGCDYGQDVPGLVAALPGLTIESQQRHLAGTLVSIRAAKASA